MTDSWLFWSVLLTYLIHSSILLGATWILFRWGRWNSPAIRETIWKFAAVAPFLTTALHVGSVTAFWSVPITIAIEQVEQKERPVEKPIPLKEALSERSALFKHSDSEKTELAHILAELKQEKRNREKQEIREHPQEVIPAEHQSKPVTREQHAELMPASRGWTHQDNFGVLSLLIALIVLAGTGRILMNFGLLNWALQNATPLKSGRTVKISQDLQHRFQIGKRIRLFQLEQITEPAACGWINWSVLLPQDLEDHLTDDELEAVLSHELAHLVRKDIWWLWLGRALCWLFPFQPLNYLAQREWRDAAESLCDQWVIDQGVSRFSLARSLTSVASMSREERVVYSLSATGSGGQQLTDRVENLLEEKQDRFSSKTRRFVLTGTSMLLVLGLLIWSPQFIIQASQVADETGVDSTEKQLKLIADEQNPLWQEYLETRQEADALRELLKEVVPLTDSLSPVVQQRIENLVKRTSQISQRLQELESLLMKLKQTEHDSNH